MSEEIEQRIVDRGENFGIAAYQQKRIEQARDLNDSGEYARLVGTTARIFSRWAITDSRAKEPREGLVAISKDILKVHLSGNCVDFFEAFYKR